MVATGLLFVDLVGCGVTLTPLPKSASAQLLISGPSQVRLGGNATFTAAQTGESNPAVTWSVASPAGTSTTVTGSISSSGLYSAPPASAQPVALIVTATGVAQPSLNASIHVQLLYPVPQISSATVAAQAASPGSFLLNIVGSGFTATSTVTVGIAASTPTFVSSSQLQLQLPQSALQASQIAVTVNNPSPGASSSNLVNVTVPQQITISGPSQVHLGGNATFTAAQTGESNPAVTWSVASPAGTSTTVTGSISSSGLYSAPPASAQPVALIVTATSVAQPSLNASIHVQLLYPVPQISSATPDDMTAGTQKSILLSGSGFIPSSIVLVDSQLTGAAATASEISVLSDTSISLTITISAGEAGRVLLRVQNPDSSSPSLPLIIEVEAASGAPRDLSVFSVLSNLASGSSATFQCAGLANTNILNCVGSSTDFVKGEGIRVVGGGSAAQTPPVRLPPVVTSQGTMTGAHTYCYMVYAADPLGGINPSSPPSCLSNEPTLSILGTYNILHDPYQYPTPLFLWYRSADGGPYRLVSVGSVSQDLGQEPSTHGGWPDPLPPSGDISKNDDLFAIVTSVNGNQLVLSVPLSSSVNGTLVDHDDTEAIQSTLDQATAYGGGILKFGDGTFNIRAPSFESTIGATSPWYPIYTSDYSASAPWSQWSYLHLQFGSRGNVMLRGNGPTTVFQTPPDQGLWGHVIDMAWYYNPGTVPPVLTMDSADADATTITLGSDPSLNGIFPGTDIWLYSGTYFGDADYDCSNYAGTAGGGCHYSELNTVDAINNNTLTLAYPLAKRFYDDGTNSFGLVVLPATLHNITLRDLTFNSWVSILAPALVYNLVIDHVSETGHPRRGAFFGGYKRDVLIKDSQWSIGAAEASYDEGEFDQFTNLELQRNNVTGISAPGSEGPSEMAQISMTEGTSRVVLEANTFDHLSTYIQATTNDLILDNTYTDGVLTIGESFEPSEDNLTLLGPLNNQGFVSFSSQKWAIVHNNLFVVGRDFGPPWVVNVGHFDWAKIENNAITYKGTTPAVIILAAGGSIKGNIITADTNASGAMGIGINPDKAPTIPPAGFDVEYNTIKSDSLGAGIYVADPGFSDIASICIQKNSLDLGAGSSIVIQNPDDVVQVCR